MDETKDFIRRSRWHFSYLGLMFLVGTLVISLVQHGTLYLVKRFQPEWLLDGDISLTLSMVPMYLIGMPALILLVKRVPAVKIEKRSMKVWQFLLALVMCFCVMYCSNIVGLVVTFIVGLFKGSAVNNVMMDVTSQISVLTMLVYMVICAPIMEELIFRKLIVDRTVRYGQGVAVLVSGLMFGLFHGNLNQFAYAFVLGMFLAFIYVKTGKIRYTIGIHMIINFVGSIVSTSIVKAMNYDAYMAAFEAGATPQEMMEIIMGALPGWIAYFALLVFVGSVVIGGIVLFIVFRKRFVLEKGEVQIPKGKRFTTVWLNVGMVLFTAYWIYKIVEQLLA